MRTFFIAILSFISSATFAQIDSSRTALTFSAYADVYYSYDLGNPGNHERPSFFYNFNRHNEANLNLGLIGNISFSGIGDYKCSFFLCKEISNLIGVDNNNMVSNLYCKTFFILFRKTFRKQFFQPTIFRSFFTG